MGGGIASSGGCNGGGSDGSASCDGTKLAALPVARWVRMLASGDGGAIARRSGLWFCSSRRSASCIFGTTKASRSPAATRRLSTSSTTSSNVDPGASKITLVVRSAVRRSTSARKDIVGKCGRLHTCEPCLSSSSA